MDTILVKEIAEKEKQLGLYDYKFLGVPIWRIVRFKSRTKLLKSKTGFEYNTTKRKVKPFELAKNFYISGLNMILLLIKKQNHIDNIIMAFPRLQKVENIYLDKFTDPIILNSNIKDSCLIFQRPLAGNHKSNRINNELVIRTDFIEITALTLSIIFLPIFVLIKLKSVIGLYINAKAYFQLNIKSILNFGRAIGYFATSSFFYYFLFKKLNSNRLFLVDREIFFPAIAACKKLSITVYELQHGITHGETPLYTGEYDKTIDPDYFLNFGEVWMGPQFSIPKDQMINIGWAFDLMTKDTLSYRKKDTNTVLIISEPHISELILKTTIDLALKFGEFDFHIRLHPQESLNQDQLARVDKITNVRIQDNSIDSSVALQLYDTVIGENSSVLYEALSKGNKVGRLAFPEFSPETLKNKSADDFFYLKNLKDFEEFLKADFHKEADLNLYSVFKPEIVNKLK